MRWRLAWPAAGLLAALAPLPAAAVEQLYANGLYPRLQPVLTGASNLAPFALLDLWLILAAGWLGWRVLVRLRRRDVPILRRLAALTIDAVSGGALVFLAFLLVWGLNYRREPTHTRLHVDRSRLTGDALARLVAQSTEAVNRLYTESRLSPGREGSTDELAEAFRRAGRPLRGGWHPRPGSPKPSAIARLFPLAGVDGLMNPWGLEVILNPEVLPFEQPFVLAHEWAHLAGHAPESEASFVAWLTCLEGNGAAQYSGWLALFIHGVRSLPPDEAAAAMARLEAGPRADLEAIRRRLRRASPEVKEAAWRAYDHYLRANRVESGLASYDEVVQLVLGSRHARGRLQP